ncbi:MAG TPA: GNAT family N-acetyltransferase, partial [Longimicrobium sp.]|nr:GNAT family N-acetyltransferase [Longimicrobium sp.]
MIETPRLLLCELTDEDHAALYEMYRDPRMNRFIGGPPPPRGEYWRKVHETWPAYYARHGFGLWATVRREDGRLMGRCGLLSQEVEGERHVEVAYALSPEFWGRGYATEAARA